jgi:hypothetical protein
MHKCELVHTVDGLLRNDRCSYREARTASDSLIRRCLLDVRFGGNGHGWAIYGYAPLRPPPPICKRVTSVGMGPARLVARYFSASRYPTVRAMTECDVRHTAISKHTVSKNPGRLLIVYSPEGE